MSKNTMGDLHEHLMMQIEALGDDDLEGDKLDEAIKRSQAMCRVADTMIDNGKLVLDAEKHFAAIGDTAASQHRPRVPMLIDNRPNGK